ncbi:hypothetical protein MJO28_002703 [Puccinia striiformis f. sp. tritici]|uniref:Uncharacterized protein n=3 Tax=Puccinia striiformis TaxID=27350 RepID=A0A0L0UU26_9BASI|nr:hypothetical protein Pst134EA_005326 [Puccinia striiformis f. sp. tritici]KAI9619176.1 hypothetical protein H4Q26_011856 [Puccinia striiformis f. sp. tritici PST-130]KNE90525.1 hypothetical protein PSTG_16042 [Puccinia striiformis f. sp. tritici PST-78]POW20884.1 hypothetical protein PSHT_03060 [Puccinia striiformis]KAH9462522.1 hypothetical protein Pst134EB_006414 [Puccinia striiformis f. sp. tritici]KAH9471426.1 hypothetical protein Pst134EA_005326 [Puccinia striiformis f. sp. tritici]
MMMAPPSTRQSSTASLLYMPPGLKSMIAAPATAASSHHYIKRSTIISCSQTLPPQQRSDSPHMLKSQSQSSGSGATSTTSHATTTTTTSSTSANSRPPSPQSSCSSPPTSLSSLGHTRKKTCPPTRINFPPPIANISSPTSIPRAPSTLQQADSKPSSQSILQGNHVHQIVLPSAHPALNRASPQIQLELAMKAEVVDGSGRAVKFEDLIDRDFKTLVIFIRHFRSGYSQRYIKRLSKIANGEGSSGPEKASKYDNPSIRGRSAPSTVSMATSYKSSKGQDVQSQDNWISANGVKVVVIGHGDYQLIDSYRNILNCPFPIYTDLSKDQKVYKLLGMKKVKDVKLQQTTENRNHFDFPEKVGSNYRMQPLGKNTYPSAIKSHHEPLLCSQESKIAFLSKVLYNAWRMPWKWSGDPQQLGGELVFEPIREEKLIKRKPIKYKLANNILQRTMSCRSASSSTCASAESCLEFAPPLGRIPSQFSRKPSCSIKNNRGGISSRPKNSQSIKDTVKDIQVQCKFIHQMTNYQDHCSIDDLMMMSGIRLTSLIQRF